MIGWELSPRPPPVIHIQQHSKSITMNVEEKGMKGNEYEDNSRDVDGVITTRRWECRKTQRQHGVCWWAADDTCENCAIWVKS